MKRVLCIINTMNTGGAETFLMKVFRALDRTKYQMDFCVNVEKNFYDKEICELGGKIFYIPPKSNGIKTFKKNLSELIKREKYEYVLRITSNAAGFLDLKIAKKAGAKICSARSSNSSDGLGVKAKMIHRLGRFLYEKYVDVKFAPSDLAAEYTFGKKSIKQRKALILNNGIDLDVFRYYSEERDKLRKELKIDDKIVVGHIGRFMEQKNHSFLLDVFREIKDKEKNAVLLLIGGNGDLEASVKEKVELLGINDSVIFAGIRSDIPQILSAMDVFVMPSFYEGMPNTVIEAQATGLHCVISNTITKQANITGIVQYLSLDDSAQVWAKKVLELVRKPRVDTRQFFIENNYDILSVAVQFTKLVFGEGSE